MEGPTPVSALIHAATMVTAGVFMIARCSPLFEYPPTALIVITFAGAMTSFLAATTGILQNDLKRVIAYSTCSQLGYMIFACGISNYSRLWNMSRAPRWRVRGGNPKEEQKE
nr:NADH dehydrogenase subunit 5, mitochondrial [Tanacetum cinerariifolium]